MPHELPSELILKILEKSEILRKCELGGDRAQDPNFPPEIKIPQQ